MRFVIILLPALLFLASCAAPVTTVPGTSVGVDAPDVQGSGELLTFSSAEEFVAFLQRDTAQVPSFANIGRTTELAVDSTVGGFAEESSFSETNQQYENVGEFDIMKTDGQFIYVVMAQTLYVFDLTLQELDSYSLDETYGYYTPADIILSDDHLVVVYTSSEESLYFSPFDVRPQQTQMPVTKVAFFEAGDRLELVSESELSGNYAQARLIDDVVYVLASSNMWWATPELPVVRTGTDVVESTVHYIDDTYDPQTTYTLASFAVDSGKLIDTDSFLLGWDTAIMVSSDAFYIGHQQMHWWFHRPAYQTERFFTVALPLLPAALRSSIEALSLDGLSEQQQWQLISAELSEYFAQFENPEQEYAEAMSDVILALEEYDIRQQIERTKTLLFKIALDDGDISYAAKSSVSGRLLNQFSLDEFAGNLRVATTTTLWNDGMQSASSVTVFDEDMNQIGYVGEIAPDERIFSVRFVGETAYMVTFRQIDPFFVIDLSDPKKPTVAGEVKLPGFSDYLHPVDENTVLGFGRDADDDGRILGLKATLFDVSDPTAPVVKKSLTLGDRPSSTIVSQDHKALTVYEGQFALPVRLYESVDTGSDIDVYRSTYDLWDGVIIVDAELNELRRLEMGSFVGQTYGLQDQRALRTVFVDDDVYVLSREKLVWFNPLGEQGDFSFSS